jgi:hypothetical protein
MRIGLLVFLFNSLLSATCHGLTISFAVEYDQLAEDNRLILKNGDTIQITTFRFYTGNFLFYHDGLLIQADSNYHLIDMTGKTSESLSFPEINNSEINSVSFTLGVDSATQMKGALNGDLDPVKGMYWTWQSGYIDFKIEGTDSKGNQNIELHIGGYTAPYATQSTVVLKSASANIRCNIMLKELLNKLNGQTKKVMSPGIKASHIADLFSAVFTSPLQ